MGLPRLKQLADLRRLGANLRVRCPRCDRAAVYWREDVIRHFHARNWNTAWEMVASRFRCRQCDGRDVEIGVVPWRGPAPPPGPLLPISERTWRAMVSRDRG